MSLRFYTNAVSQASRSLAAGAFITGLLLIGFGLLIRSLPEFFVTLAAIVFFLAGLGCCITGVKIFLAQRHFKKMCRNGSEAHRENVKIHIEEEHRP